ncbi:dynein regulatory complex subunit 2 [Toxorhynchites rutilus septentrionalis]|uniref:dynein regulatory complex subunit 2 n=1 Tax=Toxorhynchites rutilus septentrionalis TaxID=329112 RepID=UPI0024789E82|nr:dynein regulatory complex subunit 2 [Toxorhynchites rutilus septentrionalis]
MGKKKGGNKNKLAKMSEEERARYLQHRADMEEEARRRKQQLIATFMKNKLKREDAFSRLNLAKINQEWRTILRNIKCKELKNEIEQVEKMCTECIESKNGIIRRLLCDLDESEEIYSTMLHAHMEKIDKIMNIHKDRLQFLQELYEIEKKEIIGNYDLEIGHYKSKKFGLQKELECVFFGLAEKKRLDEKHAEEEHMTKKDELKNSMILKLEMITKERERHMEKLWKEFQRVLNDYLRNTEEHRNEYSKLRDQDACDTRLIQEHYVEVARLTELIGNLRLKLVTIREEHEFNMKQLQKTKMELQERMRNIKQEMEIGLRMDEERLKQLAVCSNGALKYLQNLLKRGNSILQIANFCRKFETENESLLPFVHSAVKRQMFEVDEDELKEPSTEFEVFKKDTFGIAKKFENFWMRFNKARIDCACLQEEKQQLLEENERLKSQLKDYLITVNINNGGSLESNETLLAKRPSSMKVEKVVHIELKQKAIRFTKNGQRRPVTCIEGNLSNAIRNEKLLEIREKPTELYSLVPQSS